MSDLAAIVQALNARKTGDGYTAKCPAHDDDKPSLSISQPNGKILLKCHAGCAQADVIDALKARGLWGATEDNGRKIVATYDYLDAAGKLVFQVVRYAPKDFRQRRPDGAGGWVWNLRGIKPIPYNLPAVITAIKADETVFVVEGEKDADNLRKVGITATTNAGGAGKWRKEFSEWLKGANVVILPDNDEPGRDHGKQVAAALAGIAASAKIIQLPELAPKGDVSDWLASGGTRERLDGFCTSDPVPATESPRFPRVWLDDAVVELGNDDYIKGIIGRRAFVLIYGPSGDGKTFLTIDAATHIAAGIPWRDRRVRSCLVIYVAAEAGAGIVRRFVACRDNRLSEAREGRTPLAIITRGANLLNLAELDALIKELRAISKEAGLPLGVVVFDTFSRSTPGGDENAAQDVTRAISAADQIRDELGATTIFVHHSGKDAAKGARGHSSLFAAADTVISVIERCALVEKRRDGSAGERFAFDLRVVELGQDQDGDPVTTCVVVPTDATPKPQHGPQLPGVAKVALQALGEAIADFGENLPASSTIPRGIRGVTIERWRERFGLRYGTDDRGDKRPGDTIKKAFQRAREGVLKASAVGISDPYCWLAAKP